MSGPVSSYIRCVAATALVSLASPDARAQGLYAPSIQQAAQAEHERELGCMAQALATRNTALRAQMLRASAEDTSRFSSLIFTFAQNREMLSTVLNTQFFGNFLVMVMPVSASALFFAAGTLTQRQRDGEGTLSPMFWTRRWR